MKKKNASLFVAAALLAASASQAQQANPDAILQKFNAGLAAKAPEDSLAKLSVQYANVVKRKSAYDSLNQQIIALYPKGNVEFNKTVVDMYGKAQSGNLTMQEYKQLKVDYPNQTYDNPKTMAGMYYPAILGAAFPKFLEQDSVTVTDMIPSLGSGTLNQVAWNFAENGQHLPTAEKMSKLSLDKTKENIADSAKIPEAKRAGTVAGLKQAYGMYEDTYAYILAQLGRKKEALQYQEDAVRLQPNEVDINTRYITYLNDNEQYQTAVDSGSSKYSQNHGDQKMLDQIALAYKKVNPSQSADTYIASLKAKQTAAAKAELAKEAINKPAPNFSLKNLEGKTVSLSDYKGKVVILDFWATWCGPCKMSFPGMQLAVNKYKDNPNVVFLFIDTWEHTEPKETQEAVTKFIQGKQYTFNVLYDNKADGKNFEVATAYTPFGITGIPVKFFIKDGIVQFMETGYPGSDDKVLSSVTDRVDFLL
ncbi:MAG: TlpA disulfide reductase family protein [Chitinophagaceae bacterium]